MDTQFPYIQQMQGLWESAQGYLQQGLIKVSAQINKSWMKQHNADDTHGNVTASSLLVSGQIGVGIASFMGGVNGDILAARSANTGALYLGSDNNGFLYRSNSSSMEISTGLNIAGSIAHNGVIGFTGTFLANGTANTVHVSSGLITSVT